MHVTAGKDTLDAGEAGARLGDHIAILVQIDLALDEGVGRVMTNGIEQTVGINDLLLATVGVLDTEVGHEPVGLVLANDLGSDGVEADGALGVSKQAIGHDLTGTQLVAADQHGDVAAILGQEHGLLGGGVTTTDHIQRLVAEDGHGTVTHGAGTDTVLPVLLLAGQVETAGIGTRGDDNGVGGADGLAAGGVVPLGPHLEGTLGQVEFGDGLSEDLGAEALGLLAHFLHQLTTADTVGETGEVLDVGGRGELATGGGAVGEHTLIQDGLQLSPREVDGGSVGAGAGADN